jgi:hypothetical protein
MPKVKSDLVAAEITPRSGKEREAARALQAMGFRVHTVGATISIDAPRERWKDAFAARFVPVQPKEKARRREARRLPSTCRPLRFKYRQHSSRWWRALSSSSRPSFFKRLTPIWVATLMRSMPAGSPTIKGEPVCRIGQAVRLKNFLVNCELFHS